MSGQQTDRDRVVQDRLDAACDEIRRSQAALKAPICDFCGRPVEGASFANGGEDGTGTTWVIDGPIIGSFSVLDGVTLGAGSALIVDDPYWFVCADCDPVVAADDPDALAEHAISRHPWATDLEARTSGLADLYREFYARRPRREP